MILRLRLTFLIFLLRRKTKQKSRLNDFASEIDFSNILARRKIKQKSRPCFQSYFHSRKSRAKNNPTLSQIFARVKVAPQLDSFIYQMFTQASCPKKIFSLSN